MPGAPRLESFTAGVETAVDVVEIEHQLAALWEIAAANEPGIVTRASLFNLVAYAEDETARDHAADIIAALTSRHPCRAIVLLARPEERQAALSASIAAHCHLAGGERKQVCCEQISIAAAGPGVAQLPGTVLPLLESDLPTVLWWRGNFLKRPDLFRRLLAVADRFIFDTSYWDEVPLPDLAKTIAAHRRCRFADLSWTRLAFWRGLTAELFDTPECRTELAHLESVEIIHGEGPGGRLRAELYAGWLASHLDWTPTVAKRRLHLTVSHDSEARHVGLMAVTLKSAAGEFVVHKDHGRQTASAVARLPRMCELPRRRALWPNDEGALLSQELDCPTRHVVYEQALALAVEIARW